MHELDSLAPFVTFLARALLAATFLVSAVRHSTNVAAGLEEMGRAGMPRSRLLLFGSIGLRLAGGLGLLVGGPAARPGAGLLVLFLLPATALFHRLSKAPPEQRVHQQVELLNNLAILGGLLLVLALGPGTDPWR